MPTFRFYPVAAIGNQFPELVISTSDQKEEATILSKLKELALNFVSIKNTRSYIIRGYVQCLKFLDSYTNNLDIHLTDDINSVYTTIKEGQRNAIANSNFSKMPPDILGYIASYLSPVDFSHFLQTSTFFNTNNTMKKSFNNNIRVFAGYEKLFIVKGHDEVYACGLNERYTLGVGHNKNVFSPTFIPQLQGKVIQNILISRVNTYFICANVVYACGCDDSGIIFPKGKSCLMMPAQVFQIHNKIKNIAIGNNLLFANCEEGVYVKGLNDTGQAGLGHYNRIDDFTEIESLNGLNIQYIKINKFNTYFINVNTIYECAGMIGDAPIVEKILELTGKAIKRFDIKNESLYVTCDDAIYIRLEGSKNNEFISISQDKQNAEDQPVAFTGLKMNDLIEITHTTDGSHFFHFKKNVLVSGTNSSCNLGLGHSNEVELPIEHPLFKDKVVKKIICGKNLSVFVICEDGVYATGFNVFGQLGLGNTESINTFIKINALNNKNVTNIIVTDFNSHFICRDGLYGCGQNYYGQLGIREKEVICTPIKLNTVIPTNSNIIEQIMISDQPIKRSKTR